MASTDQLVRLMKIVSKKYPNRARCLFLWSDGSGSIRVSRENFQSQEMLIGSDGVHARDSVCEWSGTNMGLKLWEYARGLVDELRQHGPSGDPMEDMLQILEAEL